MTFHPDRVDDFLRLFQDTSPRIRSVDGCRHLELWRDANFGNVLTTYSIWQDASALESYRSSELFKDTWRRTKVMFAAQPTARSFFRVMTVSEAPMEA